MDFIFCFAGVEGQVSGCHLVFGVRGFNSLYRAMLSLKVLLVVYYFDYSILFFMWV